ncbi:MAG: reverse transcriptase/maturase family protein [Gemmatales bacterium]|nr:reverse transcriptase/maturase family protein [Gemmatales bacterium]MDW8223856.1 reverse transcriptase domain-containing protein [Gemmatales bacterium]
MNRIPAQPVVEVIPGTVSITPRPVDALEDLQAELYNEVRAQGRPVRQLLTALLDRRNLYAAWRFIRSNDGADTPGVDGMTCKALESSDGRVEAVTRLLQDLSQDILQERYRPQPPRWIDVPKPSGGTRRLGILTIRDRIVHCALKNILEPILEPIFLPSSFGFRPGRDVAGALHAAVTWMKLGQDGQLIFPYSMHLDIADCFDTIDHEYLLKTVSEHVADEKLLALIRQLLRSTGQTVRHWFRTRYVGLLQGSPLSPLLCNLCLHQLDLAMRSLRNSTQGGIAYYRYADDILILARSKELARKAFDCARSVLAEMRQRLSARKAPIVSLFEGVDWLGVRLRVTANRWTGQLESGYVIPDQTVQDIIQRLMEMTTPPSTKLSEQTFDLGQWILSLNAQLRGWYQSFQYADNIYEIARTLDDLVFRRFEEVLLAVTGKNRQYLRSTCIVYLPRGFRTWQIDGRQLLVLSAEPPRRPKRIAQRPKWMRPVTPVVHTEQLQYASGPATVVRDAALPPPSSFSSVSHSSPAGSVPPVENPHQNNESAAARRP